MRKTALLRLRAEVVRASEAIQASVFAFQDAVDASSKQATLKGRRPG
jgi:hypothetical protein